MSKKIIVVGASSGIGKEIAIEHLKKGNSVVLVARRKERLDAIVKEHDTKKERSFVVSHNVTEFGWVKSVFDNSVKSLGGLDEIYYCSGVMEKVSLDEYNTEKDLLMLNANTLGAVAWLNEAANFFQKQKYGKIIGISSVAGERGRVGNPVYNASKAALTTYLEAIRNRLNKIGITVLTVKPGFVDTEMTKDIEGMFWVISANRAAVTIIKAADKNKSSIYVPARWGFVMFIIRSIPSFIFKKLSI
jgi:short-subunit dehydrogenase